MNDKMETLEELCETTMQELEKAAEKLRMSGGELSAGDVEYLDKLTHTLKSIKSTMAMMEDGGGSYAYDGGSYARRGGNRGGGSSYARGRTGNVRRDSMGRYSREGGYSREDISEMRDQLREMMDKINNMQ